MKLDYLDSLPENFFELDHKSLFDVIKGPTIIRLKGELDPPMFVTVLQHGNELSSFYAVQKFLKEKKLRRSVILFICNPEAAFNEVRQLDGCLDFNRVWVPGDSAQHRIASEVLHYAKKENIFLSVDLHNNTGKNPYYACINKLETSFLKLAALFGKHVIYFEKPSEVNSMAFAKICPAVTLECGQSMDPKGIDKMVDYLTILNDIESFDELRYDRHSFHVFQTVGRIKVIQTASIDFDFSHTGSDISFVQNIDELNFSLVKPGQIFAYCPPHHEGIYVIDDNDQVITDKYFEFDENHLLTSKREFIPAMLTKNSSVAKSDCLGYIMEKKTL